MGRALFDVLNTGHKASPYMAEQLLKGPKERKPKEYNNQTYTGNRSEAYAFLFGQEVELPESDGFSPDARKQRGDYRTYLEDTGF